MTDELKDVAKGLDFLRRAWSAEDLCARETDRFLSSPSAGIKAVQCLERLGSVLSLLYRVATCGWGCRSSDHSIEALTGKAINLTLSAVRLLRSGYYDEALALVRTSG